MKRFLILITAVWMMLGLAWAADVETIYVHVRDGTYLNGRRDPNLQSPILMTIGRGDDVEVTSVDNGWAEILGGEAGTCWCCVDYLADYPPDESAALYTVASNGRVRIRQSPDGKAVGYVQKRRYSGGAVCDRRLGVHRGRICDGEVFRKERGL